MSADALVAQLVTGLYKGSFYWLLAAGFTLIFGVTRVVNFAHAALFVLGGYLMYTIYSLTNSFLLSLVFSTLATGLVGLSIEVLLVRRVYNTDPVYQLLLTFGVALILNEAQKIIWGGIPRYVSQPTYLGGYVNIGSIALSYYSILVMVLGLLVLAVVYFFIEKTMWGLKVRAVWRDPVAAQVLRINPWLIYSLVFFIGTALAGLGGSLMVVLHPVGPGMGDYLIVYAFIVVVIAGLGNIIGAYTISLIVGIVSSIAVWLFPEIDIVLVYSLAAAVLLLRPQGLFGER